MMSRERGSPSGSTDEGFCREVCSSRAVKNLELCMELCGKIISGEGD